MKWFLSRSEPYFHILLEIEMKISISVLKALSSYRFDIESTKQCTIQYDLQWYILISTDVSYASTSMP